MVLNEDASDPQVDTGDSPLSSTQDENYIKLYVPVEDRWEDDWEIATEDDLVPEDTPYTSAPVAPSESLLYLRGAFELQNLMRTLEEFDSENKDLRGEVGRLNSIIDSLRREITLLEMQVDAKVEFKKSSARPMKVLY